MKQLRKTKDVSDPMGTLARGSPCIDVSNNVGARRDGRTMRMDRHPHKGDSAPFSFGRYIA